MTTTGGGRPPIDLTIDEVVLRGVPPQQARDVLAHLEARLTELATEWSRSTGSRSTGSRSTGSLHDRAESSRRLPSIDTPAESAAALGASVADTVWSEIGGETRHGGRLP